MSEADVVVGFDVGNSWIKGAVRRGREWEPLLSVPTTPLDGVGARLRESLRGADPVLGRSVLCVVSSVCPPVNGALVESWKSAGGRAPVQFFGPDLPIPLPTIVREPSSVGADRLLCALGARELAGPPCIVVGVGTAITVDLVDREGRFAGGAIAPGLRLAVRVLHEGTACLPLVSPGLPKRVAGLDTVEAIRSGVYRFCRGGVHTLIELLSREEGAAEVPVVVTGGDAELLLPLRVDAPVRHVPDLIFVGMTAALSQQP